MKRINDRLICIVLGAMLLLSGGVVEAAKKRQPPPPPPPPPEISTEAVTGSVKAAELPDLTVSGMHLDRECRLLLILENQGRGKIPGDRFQQSAVGIRAGKLQETVPLNRLDRTGALRKPGGRITVDTGLVLSEGGLVEASVDQNRRISEVDEGNNTLRQQFKQSCADSKTAGKDQPALRDHGKMAPTVPGGQDLKLDLRTAVSAGQEQQRAAGIVIQRLSLVDNEIAVELRRPGKERLDPAAMARARLHLSAGAINRQWPLMAVDPGLSDLNGPKGGLRFMTGIPVTGRVRVTARLVGVPAQEPVTAWLNPDKPGSPGVQLDERLAAAVVQGPVKVSREGSGPIPDERKAEQLADSATLSMLSAHAVAVGNQHQVMGPIVIVEPRSGERYTVGDTIHIRYQLVQEVEAGPIRFDLEDSAGNVLGTVVSRYEPLNLAGRELERANEGFRARESDHSSGGSGGDGSSAASDDFGYQVAEFPLGSIRRPDDGKVRLRARLGSLQGGSSEFEIVALGDAGRGGIEYGSTGPQPPPIERPGDGDQTVALTIGGSTRVFHVGDPIVVNVRLNDPELTFPFEHGGIIYLDMKSTSDSSSRSNERFQVHVLSFPDDRTMMLMGNVPRANVGEYVLEMVHSSFPGQSAPILIRPEGVGEELTHIVAPSGGDAWPAGANHTISWMLFSPYELNDHLFSAELLHDGEVVESYSLVGMSTSSLDCDERTNTCRWSIFISERPDATEMAESIDSYTVRLKTILRDGTVFDTQESSPFSVLYRETGESGGIDIAIRGGVRDFRVGDTIALDLHLTGSGQDQQFPYGLGDNRPAYAFDFQLLDADGTPTGRTLGSPAVITRSSDLRTISVVGIIPEVEAGEYKIAHTLNDTGVSPAFPIYPRGVDEGELRLEEPNGRRDWVVGEPQTIAWTIYSQAPVADYSFTAQLIKDGAVVQTFGESQTVANASISCDQRTGRCNWRVTVEAGENAMQPERNRYKVRLRAALNGSQTDMRESPAITVVDPEESVDLRLAGIRVTEEGMIQVQVGVSRHSGADSGSASGPLMRNIRFLVGGESDPGGIPYERQVDLGQSLQWVDIIDMAGYFRNRENRFGRFKITMNPGNASIWEYDTSNNVGITTMPSRAFELTLREQNITDSTITYDGFNGCHPSNFGFHILNWGYRTAHGTIYIDQHAGGRTYRLARITFSLGPNGDYGRDTYFEVGRTSMIDNPLCQEGEIVVWFAGDFRSLGERRYAFVGR